MRLPAPWRAAPPRRFGIFGNYAYYIRVEDLLNGLNEKQKEAALATEGPVLILAGPGSGKTKTLTHRIAHLLQKGVSPENILALTFTNKAAGEMRIRVAQLIGDWRLEIGNLFIGTFHSLAARILRAHAAKLGCSRNFTIFDEDDALALIKEVAKELEVGPKQFPAGTISGTISRLKNELISPEEYATDTGLTDLFPKTVYKVYSLYQQRLRDANGMDFDDLLMNVCFLFQKHADILNRYQELFRYINVDEWQDTNRAQYVFISELAKKYRNIAVVGDDAQAIYGWRGADFRNVLNFEKDWPDAKIVILEQNYRSTQVILDAAKKIISRNPYQKEKELWTKNSRGEPIIVTAAEDEKGEAEFVLNEVQAAARKGMPLKDIAVLYRTNSQSRALEEVFLENHFPYKIIGGIRFYQRKEIKDILAYLRVLANPADSVSLKRIINIPPRKIGKAAFLKYLASNKGGVAANDGALNGFNVLLKRIEAEFSARKPTDFIKYLLKSINYRGYLSETFPNGEERWENVEELVSLAKKYDNLPPPSGIEKMLEDTALMSEAENISDHGSAVTLMTLHAAKGLEFPLVFIVGMEEGIFPHSRSLFSPAELEEERRLCYVGLTRAKEKVFLSFAMRRFHFGSTQVNPPSRFLSEIPENLIEVRENEITIEAEPLE